MVSPIPTSVKKVWDKWNLRGFVIASLSLQVILILGAPFRKRTPNICLTLVIWSAYLLADWAANFTIGLIANSQGDNPFVPSPDNTGDFNSDLLAFWAPFLLLHLGGPDTITALALEDNTLWLRHLFGLLSQVIAAVYVFIQSFPRNKLWLPTALLFLAGIIKYAERTSALYRASLDNFKESMLQKPDPGPNYAKLMEEYSSKRDAKLPTHIELTAERSKDSRTSTYVVEDGDMQNNVALVRHASHFYNIFKGLIVDLIFSFEARLESREFFNARSADEVFKIVATELNFMYEALFTKAIVVHSLRGCIFRAISFAALIIALIFFHKIDKHDFHGFDVGITYTLLSGAIILDAIATHMVIFSDWTVAILPPAWKDCCVGILLGKYIHLKHSSWYSSNAANPCFEWCRRLLFRRWYEHVSGFNLIHFSLKDTDSVVINIISFLGLKDLRYKIKYQSTKPLTKELWELIFTQLRGKSMLADDPETARRLSTARGDWILQDSDWSISIDCRKLLPYVVDVEFDQSILLWHIATEFCYNLDKDEEAYKNVLPKITHCKIMSDYMVYLLVMQPTMMSSVAGIGQIRFRDTCEEAKRFFSRRELGPQVQQRVACETLLEVNTDVEPVTVKGDRSKSVLFDACILAKELMKLNEKKWELMSEVWVELLSYAAGHCRANDHVQLLSKGGELVTFVWLVMAHFGIGEQFQINEGHARAKLIVGK